jgi:O-antigen/teichoic acid export membrane protein
MRARLLQGRAVTTVADQAFSSASNFLVGVVVARLAGPGAFGAFALAYSVWLAVAGVHRALVVNPMLVADSGSHGDGDRVERALAAEGVLGLAAAAVIAMAGTALWLTGLGPLGRTLLVLAPWLPVLLVQDLWRWAGFMRGRPGKALANDVAFAVAQVTLMIALGAAGRLQTGMVLAAWGGGGAVGAIVGTRQFRTRLRLAGGWAVLRRSWPDGRWLLADFLTSYGASQAWLYLVAVVLGPASLGLLRAAQNLLGPTNVLLLGISSYGLPASVAAFRGDGWTGLDRVARRVTGSMTLGIAAYAAPLAAGRDLVVELVYGRAYAGTGVLVVLAGLQAVFLGIGFGAGTALTAARRTSALVAVRMTTAAVSAGCFLALAGRIGVAGAGWAGAVGAATYAVLMWTAYRVTRRAGQERRQENAAAA